VSAEICRSLTPKSSTSDVGIIEYVRVKVKINYVDHLIFLMYVNKLVSETERVPQPEGRAGYLRLDQNENPDGVPQWLFNRVISKLTPEFLSIYPEETKLTEKYAKLLGLNSNEVTLTDGSVVGMDYLIKIFGEPSKKLVCVTPTFGMYEVYAKMVGMSVQSLPYNENLTFNTETIINSINKETGIVVLVNPNMPVGNVYSEFEIESIVKKAKENNVFVIIDEAYHYFYEGTSINLIKNYDNVAILRTFSKMLSIPALRLGAIISSPEIVRCVNNYKPHYTVNSVALLFGEAIVDNHDTLIKEMYHNYEEGMKYLTGRLEKKGYSIVKSHGCFICVQPKNRAPQEITDALKENKILVLCGKGDLEKFIRVSVCNVKYMKQFVETLLKVDQ
jgi:histidinol-phosphate aminotransferase